MVEKKVEKKVAKNQNGFSILLFFLIVAIGVVLFLLFAPKGIGLFGESSPQVTGAAGLSIAAPDLQDRFMVYSDLDRNFSLSYPESYVAQKSDGTTSALATFSVPSIDESLVASIYLFNKSIVTRVDFTSLFFDNTDLGWKEEKLVEKDLTISGVNAVYLKSKMFESAMNRTGYFVSVLYSCPNYDALFASSIPQSMLDEEEAINYMIESFRCD